MYLSNWGKCLAALCNDESCLLNRARYSLISSISWMVSKISSHILSEADISRVPAGSCFITPIIESITRLDTLVGKVCIWILKELKADADKSNK